MPTNLEEERTIVSAVFGRADAWLNWDDRPPDTVGKSLIDLSGAIRGLAGMAFRNIRQRQATGPATAAGGAEADVRSATVRRAAMVLALTTRCAGGCATGSRPADGTGSQPMTFFPPQANSPAVQLTQPTQLTPRFELPSSLPSIPSGVAVIPPPDRAAAAPAAAAADDNADASGERGNAHRAADHSSERHPPPVPAGSQRPPAPQAIPPVASTPAPQARACACA